MSAHLALIAALMFPLPWSHGAAHPAPRPAGGWTVTAKTDPFTGGHVCHLAKRGVDYERQALVLHLSDHVDTADAVYRIDNGAPNLVSADQMELARLGFALHNDDLSNPSGGLVRVPERRVMSAAEVSVETAAFRRPVKFKIGGFAEALDAARKAGCAPGDFH